MDDLDSLLEDLNRKSTGPSKPSNATNRPISTRVDLNELEDLMEDLAAPTPISMPEPVSVQSVQSQPSEIDNMEDLDLLMESLSASSRRQSVRPTSNRNLIIPEPTLRFPDKHEEPPAPKEAPQTAPSSGTFGNGSSFQPASQPYSAPQSATSMTKVSTASGNATYNAPSNAGASGGDLDSLLNNLSNQMNSIGKDSPAIRGVCATCGNNILGEMISSLGKVYHPEHFICHTCRNPISTTGFYEHNNAPTCQQCFADFAAVCAHCNQPVTGACVSALGKKWHKDHFVCSTCGDPFPAGQFYEKNGRPYCERDYYGTFAPKCAACNQPIIKECINALGQQWHPEHFVCTHCQKSFVGGSFFEKNGKPYCEIHYHQESGSTCSGCGNPITGKCVNALSKKWHPEHFVCAFCMKPMAGGAFKEHNQKAYCSHCHDELFSG